MNSNRASRSNRAIGNGRSVVGPVLYPRIHSDMESQIHHLEQEAYCSVLRAFKAQSDALTWEKEGLITELRKELRVSDDEHRELLTRVNADDVIRRIREWRQAGGHHGSVLSTSQPGHDMIPSPTVSASRKRQKMSPSVPLSYGMPSQALKPQLMAASMQPSFLAGKRGPVSGTGGRKTKPGQLMPGSSLMKSKQYPVPTDRDQFVNRSSSGAVVTNTSAEAGTQDPLIGRKVMTRWPDDNNFYEAVISSYNAADGRHALVYDANTSNETWEWVDLKKISPEDIRWIGDNPGFPLREGHGGQGRVYRRHISDGVLPSGDGRGRGSTNDQMIQELPPSQNGVVKKVSDEIEILHTETLLNEVDKVIAANHPDLLDIQKAKKMLKEHEQALIDVIAKLSDASDTESEGERPESHEQSMDEQGGRKTHYESNQHCPNPESETNGSKLNGAEGNPKARAQTISEDNQQDDYIDDI